MNVGPVYRFHGSNTYVPIREIHCGQGGWKTSSRGLSIAATKGEIMSQGTMLFDAGFVTRTPGALMALILAGVSETSLIERHQSGDYGSLSSADKDGNNEAIERGGRIFSAYQVSAEARVLVITEMDLGATTMLLLPSEV